MAQGVFLGVASGLVASAAVIVVTSQLMGAREVVVAPVPDDAATVAGEESMRPVNQDDASDRPASMTEAQTPPAGAAPDPESPAKEVGRSGPDENARADAVSPTDGEGPSAPVDEVQPVRPERPTGDRTQTFAEASPPTMADDMEDTDPVVEEDTARTDDTASAAPEDVAGTATVPAEPPAATDAAPRMEDAQTEGDTTAPNLSGIDDPDIASAAPAAATGASEGAARPAPLDPVAERVSPDPLPAERLTAPAEDAGGGASRSRPADRADTRRAALPEADRPGPPPATPPAPPAVPEVAPEEATDREPASVTRDRVRVNRLAQIGSAEEAGAQEAQSDAPPEGGDDVAAIGRGAPPDDPTPEEIARFASPAPGRETGETPEPDRRTVAVAPPFSGAEAERAPVPDDADDTDTDTDTDGASGVALVDNAEPLTNPTGLPLMSVILLDYGGRPVDLPLQLSIALDPGMADAAERARMYRTRGYEVLFMPSLPRGATPQDVEQAYQVNLASVPGAVAVLPDPLGPDLRDTAILETLVGRLGETGHGLVTLAQGLDGARRIASRNGVPAGQVYRQIDDAGQDLRAVKRFLDQAAFRARQEGNVILVGRNRPETTGALDEWTSGGTRASSVALAPLSAILRPSDGK